MSDNPPTSNSESTSNSGNGPHAKKAKTSEQNPTDVIPRPDTSRDGGRKIKLTLQIADVNKFLQDETLVESDKKALAGIDWSITAEMVGSNMALNLNAFHPTASQWHCKASFVFREPESDRSKSKKVVAIFTEKYPRWGYSRWLQEEDLEYEYDDDEWTAFCEVTTFNCYVTDGAFGCQSRFHDVTFDFGDRRLYANKGFLAANADFFESMFFGDFADKNKDVVTLKKVKADDFEAFLIALAPGQMPIQEKNVVKFLRMADRFQAHEMVERCTSALLRETSGIPFSKKLQIADDLLMDDFRDTLVETATCVDIKQAAKLKNENKFSKTAWVKLLLRHIGDVENPPPNPPPNENTSTSGNGPRAKKAKTSDAQSSDSITRLDAARGGSRKGTLTLFIDDVAKFVADKAKVEGDKITLSGIDWRITAETVDGNLSVMLKGSHPSLSEWHCRVNFNVREPIAKRSNDDIILMFTHKNSSWGYNRWMTVEKLLDDYNHRGITFEMTTFNCYVTDGAFGCRSRFHDVTFDFGHRHIYANKGFLAANAECFEAMFFGDFADKSKDVVTLKKVKADDFAEFLKALAPSPMPVNDKNVMNLLRLADRFQAHQLVERCANFLLRDKRNIRFVKKLQIADEMLMSHLRDKLIETASERDIKAASKLKNESKFSKLTWIKLFREYMRHHDESSNSESDSDGSDSERDSDD